MSGNGVRIGMEIIVAILRAIQWELLAVLSGCSVAVAGTVMLGFVVCRIVTSTRLATVTIISVCVWYFNPRLPGLKSS